jgi:hypothetical protein
MGLPRAILVPCLPNASRKDRKQVGVGLSANGDFNLVPKGEYCIISTWGRHGVVDAI